MGAALAEQAVPQTVGLRPLAPPQTYSLPTELARQLWRMTCDLNEQRPEGASESGLMEAAWEAFLDLPPATNLEFVARTFARRNATVKCERKSYSLPKDLVVRVQRRLNDLKELSLQHKSGKLTLWLLAEAAQIHLIGLRRPQLEALLKRVGVRKKRCVVK